MTSFAQDASFRDDFVNERSRLVEGRERGLSQRRISQRRISIVAPDESKYGHHPIQSHWFPAPSEDLAHRARPVLDRNGVHKIDVEPVETEKLLDRSMKRRLFLFLTEPTTSKASAIFFAVLMVAIVALNVIMVMESIPLFQFTPDFCAFCNGNDGVDDPTVACVCPPAPSNVLETLMYWIISFFAAEWILRVLSFEPHAEGRRLTCTEFWRQWLGFLFSPVSVLDFLATFPFYVQNVQGFQGLTAFRMVRMFRVFQLVRLGQYSTTFQSLVNVMHRSTLYLKLLALFVGFGAAFFGSLMYWLEQGNWAYDYTTESFEYMRTGVDGQPEISPFTSIPESCWWFIVTVTTVGYGDVYPTSPLGRLVAVIAMGLGILVIAFPVSVFSDLWSKEVDKLEEFHQLQLDIDESEKKYLEEHPELRPDFETEGAAKSTNSNSKLLTGQVVMEKDDVNEIMECLQKIRAHEQFIATIMKKYE